MPLTGRGSPIQCGGRSYVALFAGGAGHDAARDFAFGRAGFFEPDGRGRWASFWPSGLSGLTVPGWAGLICGTGAGQASAGFFGFASKQASFGFGRTPVALVVGAARDREVRGAEGARLPAWLPQFRAKAAKACCLACSASWALICDLTSSSDWTFSGVIFITSKTV